MILYILVAALTTGLACGVQNGSSAQVHTGSRMTRRQGLNLLCLGAVFSVLFWLSALRLEVGNDYGTYVDTIHEIYVGGYVVTEPLFNALVKLLCVLSGGENYLLVFAFFAFITVALFLVVLVEQSDSFPLAFFLFMTLGLYFRTFNTVRYYFALAVTLYSFRYVLRKEYGKFILLIGITALIHKSVLIVIPLYLAANYHWKKWQIALAGTLAASLLLFQDFYLELALKLYPSYQDTIYLENTGGIGENILSIARCVLVLVLALSCYREAVQDDPENLFYFRLNLMAAAVYIFCSFLPLVGRFGYYLMTSHILFIPSILSRLQDKKKKRLLTGLVVAAALVYFAWFLKTASADGVRVLPYKSWLFYEKEFLNATEIF